ncbi:MAG: PRC-barrel domain-containing protein [Rhodospirillales bacterium]
MQKSIIAACSAFALLLSVSGQALAAGESEGVLMIDQPDVQMLQGNVDSPSIGSIIGSDVYSNAGQKIGEIDDFVLVGGELYAVLDVDDGPLEQYVEASGNEEQTIVVPARELRTADRPAESQ